MLSTPQAFELAAGVGRPAAIRKLWAEHHAKPKATADSLREQQPKVQTKYGDAKADQAIMRVAKRRTVAAMENMAAWRRSLLTWRMRAIMRTSSHMELRRS